MKKKPLSKLSLRFEIVAITGPHLKVLLEEPILLLYESTLQTTEACAAPGGVYTRDCAAPGGVYATLFFYCRTCSLRLENNFLLTERVRFALKIIFFLSNIFVTVGGVHFA